MFDLDDLLDEDVDPSPRPRLARSFTDWRIASTNHTYDGDRWIRWWGPGNGGYEQVLDLAGVYELDQLLERTSYYLVWPRITRWVTREACRIADGRVIEDDGRGVHTLSLGTWYCCCCRERSYRDGTPTPDPVSFRDEACPKCGHMRCLERLGAPDRVRILVGKNSPYRGEDRNE